MKKLKREIPKNYSFLDLVAPSYNRVKITPKFVEGGGTPIKMTEPTMFMPPQSLNSGQPALLNSTNEFDWNKQRLIDPGNALWNEHKKLYPNHKDGSKYHEYFLCNLNPDMCGGPNPQFRNIRNSQNPEIQQLVNELDPLFDKPDKNYSYTLEQALSSRARQYYNKEVGLDADEVLNKLNKTNLTSDQQQKLQRLYDLSLKDSGNEIVYNPKETNPYAQYTVNWKSPSQWNYQNKAAKFYNDQEAFATGMDAWNNRNLNTDTVPNIQAPVVNTPTPITPKVNPINLPQMQFPNMQSSNLEPIDDTRNTSLRDFNPFGTPQITPQVPNTIATNKTTYPISLPNSPLNPNYKPPVNSGFSMTNPYDSSKTYAGDWLNRFKETERNNNPELSQDEIDRITAEDNALNNIIDSNYGFNSSSMPRVNENISNNQLANLPNQNQWSNLQEPLPVQRPSEYADPQQAIIGSIKTDFKPADPASATLEKTKDKTDSTKGFNYKRAARVGAFNAGLNLAGNMYNMSRMRNQENFNSFITQQPEAIYPNKRMLYGDKSMFAEYGGEFIKYEGGGSWTDYLNPMNWGVEDYSEYSKFANAYRTAKSNGKEEFLWNGKRYNTKYAGTPRQEIGMYGANGKKVSPKQMNNPYLVNYYTPKLGYYLPGHIEAANREGYAVNNSSNGNSSFGIDPAYEPHKGKSSYFVYGADSAKFRNTVSNLPMGDYQYLFDEEELKANKFNTGKSTWNLLTNNCADGVCDAFGIPKSGKVTHPVSTLSKISNKYPTLNITGRDMETYENKIKEYIKADKNNILKQSEYFLGIVNSPEFVNGNSSYRKKVISAIQDSLHKSGYSLPNSQKSNGTFDGIMGPETQTALQKYNQQSSKKKENGGEYQDEDLIDISHLIQFKKGGIYIKPENKGKFTAWAQSHGMSVQEAASHVMANKEKYSSTTVKRANFAKNASKWKHEDGGQYSYGGHYIPMDVPYLAGKFVPNPIDLQEFKKGGMIKRADGSYSKRGLWDNIRANKGSGKKPTKEMLKQERKIKKGYKAGGEYMEGNEYEISGVELERLRSLGYDVEII
jgi:hypothetical protein